MEYYIYAYLDPSIPYENKDFPEIKNVPIYIGRGKNDRLNHHWKSVTSGRKLSNIQFYLKLKKMKNSGISPIITILQDNLTLEDANFLEKRAISLIGRRCCDGGGILLNVTEGGDGGITWIGENPFKGKSLEELYGLEKSQEMKRTLSESTSKRTGELNPMFGIKGEEHPLFGERSPRYGVRHNEETREKISDKVKEFWKNMSQSDIDSLNDKIKASKSKWTDEYIVEIKRKISEANKDRIFSDTHIENLSAKNYRKLNKGTSIVKLKETSKEKISASLRGRSFSDEHKKNLRNFNIEYGELKKMVIENGIRSKREYREWVSMNNIDAPLNPNSKSFGEKWQGWRSFLDKQLKRR
jgi:hypothetical protein